jgi:hypothetical protein
MYMLRIDLSSDNKSRISLGIVCIAHDAL